MAQCQNCQYQTNSPKQMERHVEKTRHGRQKSPKRAFRGHLAQHGKKKASGGK